MFARKTSSPMSREYGVLMYPSDGAARFADFASNARSTLRMYSAGSLSFP